MEQKCNKCMEWYLKGATFCGNCGCRFRVVKTDTLKESPKNIAESDKNPDQVSSPEAMPGVHIKRSNVGQSNRKVSIKGVGYVSDAAGNIAYDEDEINIDASSNNAFRNAAKFAVPSINVKKDKVGYDESTTNINVVVNQFIDPSVQQQVRPWEHRDPDADSRKTQKIFIATRETIMEFTPDSVTHQLNRTGNYRFKEKIRNVRSLTPLDVAGEIVLLVGTRERVGIWQPLGENKSELGFYRCISNRSVSGGFNSATAADGYIFGAHSEKGLIRWPMSEPDNYKSIKLIRNPHPSAKHCFRSVKAMPDGTLSVILNRSILNLASAENPRVIIEYKCPDIEVRRCRFMDRNSSSYDKCHCVSGMCLGPDIGWLSDYIILNNKIFAVSENGFLLSWNYANPTSGKILRNFGSFCFNISSARLFGSMYLVIGSGYGVFLIPTTPGIPEWYYPYVSGKINYASAASDMILAGGDDLKTMIVWDTRKQGEQPVHVIPLKTRFGSRGQSITVLTG